MAITDTALRSMKAPSKATKLFDSGGLFILVTPPSPRNPKGSKLWRLKYRIAGREKLISFGPYPAISIKRARELRDEARTLIVQRIDPSEQRRANEIAEMEASKNTFEAVGREWLTLQESELNPRTVIKARAILERWAFPWIGNRKLSDISPRELLENVLRRVEGLGKRETAHRLKQRCGQIFRYGIITGRADRDPTADLHRVLKTPKVRNHPAITDPVKVGALLRNIDGFDGQFVTKCALKLAPLVFVRPGELRAAEWKEIDLDSATWNIPAHRMKMDSPHVVPLATQAVAILRELQPVTGKGALVFPGIRSAQRPMSENTINGALRSLGYEGSVMVAHGFRTMASTLLNGKRWDADIIEAQLAHKERNEVRAVYNKAKYLPERQKMMQFWADYLDELKSNQDKDETQ